MSMNIFLKAFTSFHTKAQRHKERFIMTFFASFAPLREYKLSCILFVILTSFSPNTASHAAPNFTKSEQQALLEYARGCMIAHIGGTSPPPPPPCATNQQRACFVTFFSGKRVFACFGGFTPRRATLAEEINENVRLALKNDSRARSATAGNVARAGLQITFPTGQPERVERYQEINPVTEGMFVEGNGNGVVFVPGEARTAQWAFREALRRLGEDNSSAVAIYRFKADAISTR